jgi:sulfate transport system substrate-binding protein
MASVLNRRDTLKSIGAAVAGFALASGSVLPARAATTLLNVSYDPTRELYKAIDAVFIKDWKQKTGEDVAVQQSHGGSGKQARSVIDGLQADVVTLALEADIDAIAKAGKIKADWKSRLPNDSAPYTSTIVFLVRKGNPKGIKDWGDLVKGDVQIVTPNPKTSGGARWNYLAAWAWANKEYNGDQGKVKAYITELYKRAPVLDSGARGATTSFAEREIGDVLLSWENDAYLAQGEFKDGGFEIVVPSLSILAQPNVAVVDSVVDAKGTRKVAEAYLKFLYTPEAQKIIAENHYRPLKPVEGAWTPPKVNLVTVDDPIFGGWKKVQKLHFDDGGIFDEIYKPAN